MCRPREVAGHLRVRGVTLEDCCCVGHMRSPENQSGGFQNLRRLHAISERKAKRKLHHAWTIRTLQGRERRAHHIHIRWEELDVVECIERLSTELQVHVLANQEVLE